MRRGFTLVELLVVVAIIALLIGLLAPGLSAARERGQAAACLNNLRQLGAAVAMYANDYNDRCVPLAYWSTDIIGSGPVVYWWGTNESGLVDSSRGFVTPYLQSELAERSVYECPRQPWGSYKPQGAAKAVTSTYGYNGYYLSPEHTPGWAGQIGHRPWQSLGRILDTSRVVAFADSLIDLGGGQPRNSALLDPPQLFAGGAWIDNPNPTTAFRHRGATQAAHVDGHAESYAARDGVISSERFAIGSISAENGPAYVPDWRSWDAPAAVGQ